MKEVTKFGGGGGKGKARPIIHAKNLTKFFHSNKILINQIITSHSKK